MTPETINLPSVTTGIALSSASIQLLSFCIANCPLTEKQRFDLNQEFISAIKTAVDMMGPSPTNRLVKVENGSDP